MTPSPVAAARGRPVRTHFPHDLVLIGSPTAEGLSRILFGYSPDGHLDSLAMDQAPVDLPFRWVISKNEVDELIARHGPSYRTAAVSPDGQEERLDFLITQIASTPSRPATP